MKKMLTFLSGLFIGVCGVYLVAYYFEGKLRFLINPKEEEEKTKIEILDTVNRYQEDVVNNYDFDGLDFSHSDTIRVGKKDYVILWSDEFVDRKLNPLDWNISRQNSVWDNGILKINYIDRLTTKEKMLFDRGVVEVKCRMRKKGSISFIAPSSKIVLLEKHENKFLIGQYDMENEEKDIKTFNLSSYPTVNDFFVIRVRFTSKYVEWYLEGKSIGKQERFNSDFLYLSFATYEANLKNAMEIDYVRYYVPLEK